MHEQSHLDATVASNWNPNSQGRLHDREHFSVDRRMFLAGAAASTTGLMSTPASAQEALSPDLAGALARFRASIPPNFNRDYVEHVVIPFFLTSLYEGERPVLPMIDAIKITWENTMLFEGGFTFTNFVADAFAVFMFILWFWLLITVSGDLFRRHDVSGFGKVLWVILLIVLPYIGIFAYIFTQGRGMAERNEARAKEARGELRQAVGFSVADEIEKLDRLKSTGSISEQEYSRVRSRIVQ
jgi:hypothetical protein